MNLGNPTEPGHGSSMSEGEALRRRSHTARRLPCCMDACHRTAPRRVCAQAPEVLMNQACSLKVDIYSMGVILWELCTGEAPVRGQMRNVR